MLEQCTTPLAGISSFPAASSALDPGFCREHRGHKAWVLIILERCPSLRNELLNA